MFGNPVGDRIARRRKRRRDQFMGTALRSRTLKSLSVATLALSLSAATAMAASPEPSNSQPSVLVSSEPTSSATTTSSAPVTATSDTELKDAEASSAPFQQSEPQEEKTAPVSGEPTLSAAPSEAPSPTVATTAPTEPSVKESTPVKSPKASPSVKVDDKSSAPSAVATPDASPSDSSSPDASASADENDKDLRLGVATATCTDTQFSNSVIGNFEIDGNLCSNLVDDWTSELSGPTAYDGTGDPTQFTEGASELNWPWTSNQTQGVNTAGDKSDVDNVYALQRTIGNQVYAYLGFERDKGNGTVQYVVELNALANTSPTSPSPQRSTGDLRLLVNQGGNNNLELTRADVWTSTGPTSGSWSALPSTAGFTGLANNGTIKNFAGTDNLEKGIFAEFALNLTALFGETDCSGNYGTLNIRSSSSNDNSALGDWVAPIALSIPSSCSSVVVDKTWVIDGQEYQNGEQPDGFATSLELTGQNAAEFGTEYSTTSDNARYQAGQVITVGETEVQLPEGCTYVASGDLGQHTLAVGKNSYTVTNTVTCTQLTLVKHVVGDAAADSWTLTATGPSQLSGTSGSEAVTKAPVAPGTYTLAESDGVAGYQLTGIDCGEDHVVSDSHELTIVAGDKVTCTLTNTAEVSLIVTKKWVVNGDEYANGEQPVGTAALSVDDTDQEFGTEISGYLVGDEVTIKETVSDLPQLCTVSSSIDGEDADQATHKMTISPDPNVVEVINTVDCVQQLTLIKEVDNEEFSGTSKVSDWTLTATNSADASIKAEGLTGDPAVTTANVPVGSYALTESGPEGYEAGSWSCTGTGEQSEANISLDMGQQATCTIVNTAKPGAVTWTKTDAQDRLLAGATWTLTGPSGDNSQSVEITDCTDDPCSGPDSDPAAGKFSIENLAWGDYTLTELLAPPGYQKDDTVHEFTVQGDTLQVQLAAVVNEQQVGPTLPLTGGFGRDHVYLLGAGILILGLSVLGGRFWKTRRDRTIR